MTNKTNEINESVCCSDVTKRCLQDMKEKVVPFVEKKAQTAISTIADSMASLGDTLRGKTSNEGRIGKAAQNVAQRLERGGAYLARHEVREIGSAITGFMKRHPLAIICTGLGLGILVGRGFSKRQLPSE